MDSGPPGAGHEAVVKHGADGSTNLLTGAGLEYRHTYVQFYIVLCMFS